MRRRTARPRTTPLGITRLEDRTVPHGHGEAALVALPAQFYLTGDNSTFLTGPQAGDYRTLAHQALKDRAAALGLTAADVADPVVTDTLSEGGLSHVYYRQKLNGLPVLNANIGVHLTAAGEVMAVNGGFVPGLSAGETGTPPAPGITPAAAVTAAAEYFGITLTSDPTVLRVEAGANPKTILSAPGGSVDEVPVNLTYTTTSSGVKLAWELVLNVPGGQHWYHTAVDAETGQVVFWADWVNAFGPGYKVQALPDVSPIADIRNDTRQILVNPGDPAASPFGWHDTNGVDGPEFTDTRGNNVYAQDDLDGNDFGGRRPNGGPSLFFNNPVDYAREPDTYLDALITNLFYMNNVLHDVHERYGFTEAAGNFQQRNYSGASGDKDAVQADAMDSWNFGVANNATMGTPPDGSPPRMSMFRFTLTNPNRDSDLENGIIAHEYGHGVTNRLTGGKANASALQATQSRAMGEGWSDFHALMFTQSVNSTQNGLNPQGNWVLGEGPNGGGVRQYPYTYDISINRSTFADYNNAGGTQQHYAGQIWASALWDLNWLLINKWGYDPDISTGYTAGRSPGNGPGGAGNKLLMRLVMDGLKLQPASPSFAAARDAILSADQALTGGLNKREIWRAFSRRGLGSGSTGTDPTSASLTVSTDMPAEAAFPAVIAQSPYGPSPAAAGSLTLTFSEPMDKASFDPAADVVTFTGPGGADLKASITGFTWDGPGTALTITFDPPASPQGRYALTLSPDILSAGGTDKLDQNFGGDPGGISGSNNDRYTAYWGVDAAPLTVASLAAVNGGALQSGEDSVVVTFSEPVAPGSLSVTDLQTTNGEVVAFVQIAPNQVRYDLTQLAAGPLYYSFKLSAVTDAYGFGSRVLNGSVTVVAAGPEIEVTPLPTPLTPIGAMGWQAYQGGLTTWVNTPPDTDTFTVTLDAGTRVTAVVDQVATLQPVLTVVGPLGTVVGTAQAFGPGGAAVVTLDLGPAGVAGDYRLTVSGANGTTGAYRARLVIGAATEPEAAGGAANNTLATAQPFALIPYGDGAAGATVTGAVGQTLAPGADPADVFSIDLAAGDTLAVGLTGSGAAVRLRNANGVAVGTANAPTNYDAGVTFAAPAAGTYYVEVTSGTGSVISAAYAVSVVRNGVIERESNGTSQTAQPLPAAGGVVRGGLEGVEADFYSITVPAGGSLTIATGTPGGGLGEYPNALDPVVDLFRGASNIGSDDNQGGDGKNALLRRTNLTAGTYVIRVTSARSTAGEYFLRVLTSDDPGPVNVGATVVTADRYTVAEGGSVTLTATGADGDGDPLALTWDLNGDGVFGDATGPTPTVTWAQLQALAPAVDNAPTLFRYPVRVRATDGNTTVTSTGVVLTVTNTAPTGTPTAGRQVGESEAVLVGFAGDAPTAAEEPSKADRDAGLRYAYDFDRNGTWDTGDRTGTYAGAITERQTTIPLEYIADGPGSFTVRMRVIDQDGGFTQQEVTFTVVNTAPVATFAPDPGTQTPPNAFKEGETGRTLAVAQVLDSARDRAAGFVYSFSADGGQSWFLGGGTFVNSVPLPGGAVDIPADLLADGPGSVTITGRVFDKDGAGSDFTRTVVIQNVDPVAPIDPAQSTAAVDEGGEATVVLAPPADPSAGDRARGFRYAYSLDGGQSWLAADGVTAVDGTWDGSAASTSGTFRVPASATDDGSGTVTVTARVIDKDNGRSDTTLPIVVRNVAPTATPVAPPNVVVGTPLTVTLTDPRDPSAADTRAGFFYSFDFNNDGDFRDPGEVSNSTSPTATFTYQTPGAVRVRVVIADRNGGPTGQTPYIIPVSVDNVAPTAAADPVAPINEGGTGTIRVTASHPSAVTTAATFRYAYDFDGNGTWDLGDGSGYGGGVRANSAAIPPAFVSDGGVTRDAVVRVFEVNGLSRDVRVPVTVNNVAPAARLVVPAGRIEVRSGAVFGVAGQSDPSPQDQTAGFRYSWDFNNDGDFADPSELVDSPVPTAAAEFTRTGPQTVRVRVTDKDGGFTDLTAVVTVGTVTKTWYAAGVGAGNAPVARLYDTDGNTAFSGAVFDANATGGVRVVSADVNGDGTPDLIAATGPGVPAQVKVIDGKGGGTLFDVRPFGTFAGGAFVAAGDVDGDGFADVAVTPDEGGGPRVVMYSGRGFRQTASFFGIADADFRGGARVAMADVNGDGMSDLLVAAGFGGGPRVAGYDGAALFTTRAKLFGDFFAFDPALRNGVYLSGGDMTGDGRAELVVGAGPGGGPQVLALDGAGLMAGRIVEQASFFSADISNRDGVRVSVADIDADGRADIVTGDASGPKLLVFRGTDLKANGFPADPLELFPFSTLTNGVFVG